MTTKLLRTVIIGWGKIARAEHAPAIARSKNFELVARIDPTLTTQIDRGEWASLEAFLASGQAFDAVVLAMPPRFRFATAQRLAAYPVPILLEKPPFVSWQEALDFQNLIENSAATAFTAWHSRYASAVSAAKQILLKDRPISGRIDWYEDDQKWHPGQDWLWQKEGFGVLDPGINALSILSEVCPQDWRIGATKHQFRDGAGSPERVQMELLSADCRIEADFYFLETEQETWSLQFTTQTGRTVVLQEGGAKLFLDEAPVAVPSGHEYDGVYSDWYQVIQTQLSVLDFQPLKLALEALE